MVANGYPVGPQSCSEIFQRGIERGEQVDQVGDSRDLQRPTRRGAVGDDSEADGCAIGLVVGLHQHLHPGRPQEVHLGQVDDQPSRVLASADCTASLN